MRIAIVGGHGKVALQLHPILVRLGHTPVALVRSEDYRAELEGLGAEVRLLDIERQEAGDFAAAFDGCDAVVFSAGGGPDGNQERKQTVDLEGSLKSIQGAKEAGIRRFLQVSAINVDEPLPTDTEPVWRAYVEAKRDADAALRISDLDWTIIRPGTLTDGAGTGLVALGRDLTRGEIPRTDVATVLAISLDNDGTIGRQWDLIGGDTPIADAIEAAVGRVGKRG
ncbi:SDR family oxidoreductase [Microlunatus elymi]|uniref:SDR family oxidoreductase n=1 Tax=Microlunatus elymi TaxID=2596828 RepID=A0A516Q3W5_9ACTN|nr:SDR family oxidoreductase [Microlunatus elymi]QDP97901.1 SDR family oxidoreductase [Microlunatus elymi]